MKVGKNMIIVRYTIDYKVCHKIKKLVRIESDDESLRYPDISSRLYMKEELAIDLHP